MRGLLSSLALLASLSVASAQVAVPLGPGGVPVTPTGPLPFTPATIWNPKDHNGVCDGVTNDTAAFSGAPATSPIAIPGLGTLCNTTFSFISTPNQLIGPGQIIGSDANHRAPITTNLSSAPGSFGDWSTASTAFNGDLSHTWQPQQHIVTGTSLGQPAGGYSFLPEASAKVLSIYNTSGWNQSISGNGGRTGLEGLYIKQYHYGQGDLSNIFCDGFVASTLANGNSYPATPNSAATSYLASPASECLSGQLFGLANGSYLEFLGDMNLSDQATYDIAAVGEAFNFTRGQGAENIGAFWMARYIGIPGALPIDVVDRVNGPIVAGYDLTNATMGYYRLGALTLGVGGTGYTTGDILTVSGGTTPTNGPATKLKVTASAGVITALSLVDTGIYTAAPVAGFSALTLTGGTGTGVTATGQYTKDNAFLLPAAGGCIGPGATTGSAVAEMSGIYGRLCLTTAGLIVNGINSVNTGPVGAANFVSGDNNNAGGSGNSLFGSQAYDEAQKNAFYFSSGSFSGVGFGRSQTSIRIFRNSGTAATLRLTADLAAAGSQNTYLAPANSAHNVTWRCNVIDVSTPANTATWKLHSGSLTRAAGNAAYVGDGSTATAFDWSTGTATGATITVSADTTNQGINFTFTAPAGGDNWRAQCELELDQLLGT